MVTVFFGKAPKHSVNPDHAVPIGATIQAGIIAGKIEGVILVDVTPLSLGIGVYGGEMSTVIKKNSSIPCIKTKVYETPEDDMERVTIKVYQGENEKKATDNAFLGSFTLSGIPLAPKGVPIKVTFKINFVSKTI